MEEAQKKLCIAITAKNIVEVQKALKAGADVTVESSSSSTGRRCPPIVQAVVVDSSDIAQLLLEHGADVNQAGKEDGTTALLTAAENGFDRLCELLLSLGAESEKPNHKGWTPLMAAASNGHLSVCQMLMDQGVSEIDSTDPEGLTPLMGAATEGHVAVCSYLLEEGAKVNHVANDGDTALCKAAAKGLDAICQLLVEQGADVKLVNSTDGWSPLMYAARYGHETTCQFFIDYTEHGPSLINKGDQEGCTP